MKWCPARRARRGWRRPWPGGEDPLSRETPLSQVWGIEFDPGTANLDVNLSNLRRKLAEVDGPTIEAFRGRGWDLVPPYDSLRES